MLKQSAVNTYAMASPVFAFTTSNPAEFEGTLRLVKLHYFMEHSLLPDNEKPRSHIFANVCIPNALLLANLLRYGAMNSMNLIVQILLFLLHPL